MLGCQVGSQDLVLDSWILNFFLVFRCLRFGSEIGSS